MIYYAYLDSPIEPILLTADGRSLTGLFMSAGKRVPAVDEGWVRRAEARPLPAAMEQLTAYFEGRLRIFDLPLAMHGSDFQKRAWKELRKIPYGESISYGELAKRVGTPRASRAVGQANARNPISIVVPCHRVNGASGDLVGYGGGLPRKEALLAFEAAVCARGTIPPWRPSVSFGGSQ